MSKIKLNNVDLAWLRMENPSNPMMITVLLQFQGRLNYDELVKVIDVTFGRYRRFHQRIVLPSGLLARPYWEDSPGYCTADHIERAELRMPIDEAAVEELVMAKMNSLLDFARPLWQITFVNNHPAGTLLIVRVHHCIGDGISLMRVLLQMTQTAEEVFAQPVTAVKPHFAAAVPESAPSIPQTAAEASGAALKSSSGKSAPLPSAADILAASLKIVFRRPDPSSILKGPLGRTKRAVWSEPFSLPEIKRIAKAKGATVNDVLMAMASGAIRRYMDLHKKHPSRNIRSFIMVNLRGHSIDYELGNKFGLVFLNMPIDRATPQERLDALKQGMDSLKASAEYAATYFILNILGSVPKWIEDIAILILDAKGTVVSTNVPGPRHEIYLAGTPISSIKAWVPQSGRIGVGLSFISYNDQVMVGLNVDAGLVPDPEVLLDLFSEEFRSYQALIPEPVRDWATVGA